jgi:glycosyltransferase involved in cell wall biosynthesis
MKVGYFSHSNFLISETFIYDLVKSLNADRDIDLTYYSGKYSENINVDFDLKSVQTGFVQKREKLSYMAYKVGRTIGNELGFKFKMAVQQRYSYKTLTKTIKEPMDVAFIEYANSAVLLRKYLNSKKIPFIVHVHGYDITSSLNDPEYVIELQNVLREATYLVAASDYMRRLLVLLGADENKIRVIRIGIDVAGIKPMAWNERVKRPPSIIFLGSLTEKKHPIALLYAFKIVLKKIPDAKLTIIGEGSLKNEVINTIKLLKIEDSVSLLGSLTRKESFPILNTHWLYAQHSVTAKSGDQEGFALSPAEAAAHELPVVSTLHNGIPEHVVDGVTGYLVPEFNYEAMAEKIIYLLQNPKIAEQMGKAGRINIKNLNNQQVRVAAIKSLLQACLE